ncbi:MAG: tetraacyldisaccharide 4'-kinase [Fibrobacter sp.]|nr:tetraacyldisaccharide 4'-kinase [Fibrobacter sp.]
MVDCLNKFKQICAAYYWAAYLLHHAVCLRPGEPLKNSRLVVVGSFRAGGAGKTPFCLKLAKELLMQGKTVAVLCHRFAFDEKQMYRQALDSFIQQGKAEVIATSNRYRTAHALDQRTQDRDKVSPDFILCDDGFEDSRLRPDVIFRLDWEKAPTDINQLIPAGKFRSLRQDHLKDEPRTVPLKCFGTAPDVIFKIESITNAAGDYPKNKQSIAICGLGDPQRFFNDLKKEEYPLHKTICCPDHDKDFQQKVEKALQQYPDSNIIISEKDSVRLSNQVLENPKVYIARQSVTITKKIVL